MKFMYFSIKSRHSDILLNKHKLAAITLVIVTVYNHVTCGQCANRMLQRILMENQYILAC